MATSAVGGRIREELQGVGSLIDHLWTEISWRDVRSGRWFTKMLTLYVAYHEAHRPAVLPSVDEADRDDAVEGLIDRVAVLAALSGAGAGVGVTAASIATSQTSGMAGPLVWPLAVLGMTGELALRALMHLRMACEIAEVYGLRFPPGRESELVRVYALAMHAEMHETEHDPGRGIVERVMRPRSGGLGKLIAARLVGESLLRNAVPFADVFVSSFQNWKLTREVGEFVHQYVGRRVQLDAALSDVSACGPEAVDLALEGVWFIFIADGRLTGVETALLAHLLRREGFEDITPRFVSDEAGWLERLKKTDPNPQLRSALLRALSVAASVDGTVAGNEGAIVGHAAEALGLAWEIPLPSDGDGDEDSPVTRH